MKITDEEVAKRKENSDRAYAEWGKAREARRRAQDAEDEAHNTFVGLLRLYVEGYTEQIVRGEVARERES